MMDRRDFDDQVIDFLYEDMDPAERSAFQGGISSQPEFQDETRDFQRVGQIFRSHLPDLATPPALTRQLLSQLPKPKRRKAWFRFEMGSFWRPALSGAFALALTLFGLYEYKQHRDGAIQVAQETPVADTPKLAASGGGDLNLRDLVVAAQPPRQLPAPAWRQPRLGNGGLISFASYGNNDSNYVGAQTDEIYGLEQEAQNTVAQFAHQQAMRMHAMGDHQGAAEALAALIKKYPNYPRIFEALALRIGCLYQIGQVAKAEQELSFLRQNSPELAQLVEQRWRQ